MPGLRKPMFSVYAGIFLVVCVSLVACKFSFADSKQSERGTLSFGAEKKPVITSTASMGSFKTIFADVAEKVTPSIVSVTSTKNDTVLYQDPFGMFFGNPFDNYFDGDQPQHPNQQRRLPPGTQRQIIPQTGVGSGVIVSNEGHIITNYHVIGKADEITVKLADGRSFNATVVGSDSLSDVAVIKIKEKVKELPVAYLGDSDKLRPGDWAMAIGTPFNLASTVTVGIISALNRTETATSTTPYQNFIQTDAAINPGNSGGALVNIDGEVIGINTMILSRSGGSMGIGFAIPINMARSIMEDLIYDGKVTRGFLGVMPQTITADMREALGLGDQKGVLLADVTKGQPADQAGMKRGDIIVSINGKEVNDDTQLRNAVAAIKPKVTVPVVLLRNGKKMTVQVKLAERNEKTLAQGNADTDDGSSKTGSVSKIMEKLGITVGPITAEARSQLNLSADAQGVIVMEIAPSSLGAREGLQKYDIIREVNQKPVASVKEFNESLKEIKAGSSVLLLIQRRGQTFFTAFKIKE